MDIFLLVTKYIGLIVTSGMAVFSLFFEFTITPPGATYKTLTRHGWIALVVTVFSAIVGLGAAVVADVRDADKEKEQATEQRRLVREINLGNETLTRLELHVEFDAPVDWRDDNFLNAAQSEELYGMWSSKSRVLADWVLTKLPSKQRTLREARFVETRPAVIKQFIEQNQPGLLANLPDELLSAGDEDYLKDYHSPSVLYLDQSTGEQYSNVDFTIDYSPRDRYRYPTDDKRRGLIFKIDFSKRYSEILNSKISISYRFRTQDFIQTGSSPFNRQPNNDPFVLKYLKSIYLYLDNQPIARIWQRPDTGRIVTHPNSEWDVKNDNFYAVLVDYTLTRNVLLDHFDPAREGHSADAGDRIAE